MSDTDNAPLEGSRKRRLVIWGNEFNVGIATLTLTVACGIYYFGGELKTMSERIDQNKREATADAVRSKEAIANVAADVKGIQTTVNSMNETLAGIKVMQQIQQQQQSFLRSTK